MKKVLFFTLLFFSSLAIVAQDDDRYDAIKIKKTLYLRYDPATSAFVYKQDEPAVPSKANNYEKIVPLALTDDTHQLNIMMQFFNPLRASVSVSTQNESDPNALSLAEFMKVMGELGSTIGAKPPGTPLTAADLFGSGIPSAKESDIRDETLRHMLLHLKTTSCCCADKKCSTEEHFKEILQILANCEKVQVDFLDSAQALYRGYEAVSGIKNYDEQKNKLTGSRKRLEKSIDNITDSLGRFERIYVWLEEAKKSECDICRLNAAYAHDILVTYRKNAEALQSKRRNLKNDLVKIEDRFNSILAASDGEYWLIKTITVPEGERVIVKISMKELQTTINGFTVSFSEGATHDCQFRISRYSACVLEFGAGLVYSPLETTRYGIDKNNVITKAGNEKVNGAVISQLNLVFPRPGWNPLLQIGCSVSEETPLLLFGGGLRMANKVNHIVISGGIAFAWSKQLQNLSVGQAVDGEAELKSDLKYEISDKPSWYIGLQYSVPLSR